MSNYVTSVNPQTTGVHVYIGAREVGYGTKPDRAYFAVDGWSEWIAEPVISEKLIVGTSRSKRQIVGYRPKRVTYSIITTYDEYYKLKDMVQDIAQPLVLEPYSTTEHDSEFDVGTERYVVLNDIVLDQITEATHIAGQRCRATVTFSRET